MEFAGKKILVTGAGQGKSDELQIKAMTSIVFKLFIGIGRDLVDQLVKNGANVVAVSRSAGPLEALKKEWPRVEIIQLDISDWKKTKELLGKVDNLDGLVNNAGIAIIKSINDITEEDFDNTIAVNLKGQFVVTQTLLPKMNNGASIVNISSLAGLKAFSDHSVYSMSKAGLDAFTRSLALELGPRKIRVNRYF